jgi:hypothetical protein
MRIYSQVKINKQCNKICEKFDTILENIYYELDVLCLGHGKRLHVYMYMYDAYSS